MRKVLRYLLLFLLFVVLLLLVGGFLLYNDITTGPLPQHSGELTAAGLDAPVEILRDEWGVPHIYASTSHDLFFAQGFTQAQDRWWQMEFSRHIGRGAIQELTGLNAGAYDTDIFIRRLGLYQAAQRDFENYSPEAQAALQAFADGVNAYLLNRPARYLAMEYSLLSVTGVSITVEPWTPLDTIVWSKVMALNLDGNRGEELARSEMLGALDPELVDAYFPTYPYDSKATIVTEADLPISDESLGAAAALPVDTAGIAGITRAQTGLYGQETAWLPFGTGSGIGSNNWSVAGSNTATGTPLLANDPHLGIQMPSIWYEIGLHCAPVSAECPYDVVGFAFAPSLAVVIGHNARIAWGVTTSNLDTQDYYEITVNPDNPLQYEFNGEWLDMTTREETINFGDGEPSVTFTVRETRFGPIVTDNNLREDGTLSGYDSERPLALRWAALEQGTLLEALLRLNRAGNWAEFREALRYWDAPSQNFVYADVDGNIGYQLPGRVPVRASGHTGTLPVPGSSDAYDWRGYVPFDLMPRVYNPARGYVQSANQATVIPVYYEQLGAQLGPEYGDDPQPQFSFSWDYGYRGARIVDLLEATDQHSTQSFAAIHGDNEFTFALEIRPYLESLDFGSDTLNGTRDWLLTWDAQMDADSPQAAFFGLFFGRLIDLTYNDQLAVLNRSASSGSDIMWTTALLLEQPEHAWWDDVSTPGTSETRDDILIRAFSEGYDSAVERLGANRDDWRWGTLHTATFVNNPLGLSGIGLIEGIVNRGPFPVSGGTSIVNATAWQNAGGGDFTVRAVPSMRMIVDLGDLSSSLTIHTTGQSDHPRSALYDNMIDEWTDIEYHPMLWTREQVDAAARDRLTLQPGD